MSDNEKKYIIINFKYQNTIMYLKQPYPTLIYTFHSEDALLLNWDTAERFLNQLNAGKIPSHGIILDKNYIVK